MQTIGGFICGGDEAFEYRRMVDIEEFFVFTGALTGVVSRLVCNEAAHV